MAPVRLQRLTRLPGVAKAPQDDMRNQHSFCSKFLSSKNTGLLKITLTGLSTFCPTQQPPNKSHFFAGNSFSPTSAPPILSASPQTPGPVAGVRRPSSGRRPSSTARLSDLAYPRPKLLGWSKRLFFWARKEGHSLLVLVLFLGLECFMENLKRKCSRGSWIRARAPPRSFVALDLVKLLFNPCVYQKTC